MSAIRASALLVGWLIAVAGGHVDDHLHRAQGDRRGHHGGGAGRYHLAHDAKGGIFNDPDLAAMNARYAVVKIGGKTRVVTLEASPAYPGSMVPVFSTIPDFCAFHAKRKKEISSQRHREADRHRQMVDRPRGAPAVRRHRVRAERDGQQQAEPVDGFRLQAQDRRLRPIPGASA